MTKQAQNCIALLSGNDEDKIRQALSMLSPTVVNELMGHFDAGSRFELAKMLSERSAL